MLSLCVSTPVFASDGEISGWKYMPQGVEAPTDGYFGDTDTARLTFEALKSTRLERDAWRNTVFIISGDIEAARQDGKTKLKVLNDSFDTERKALGRRSTRNTIIGVVLGVVAGLVIGNN